MANGAYDSLVVANRIAFNFGIDDPEHIRRIERYVRIGGQEAVTEALSMALGSDIEGGLDRAYQIVTSGFYWKQGLKGAILLEGRRDSDQRKVG